MSLIPHTLAHTNLDHRKVGDRINVEFDQTLKLAAARQAQQEASKIRVAPSNPWEQHLADLELMKEAIALGERGRLTAPPNPWVAALIVDDATGKIVGRGYHDRAGNPHAEVNAVNDAIASGYENFTAATIYVTLEPCHHFGRTPPCDQLLVQKKFGRVVVALLDPDVRVAGQGVSQLKEAGIRVEVGVGAQDAELSLKPYLHHRRTGRPFVVAKVALSIDGKVACADKTSQWITGASARDDAQRLRAASQAIMIGSETAIKDNPRLNVRLPALEQLNLKPVRVLLDSTGRVTSGAILENQYGNSIIYTTSKCSESTLSLWKSKAGVEVVSVPADAAGHVSLNNVLDDLGKRGYHQLLVEGGSQVHSSLLKQGLVNQLVVYFGSLLIGASGLAWPMTPLHETIAQVKTWTLRDVGQVGNDVRLTYDAPAPSSASDK